MVDKEKIHELALDIMFDVTEEEASDIESDFVTLEKMLSSIHRVLKKWFILLRNQHLS